MRVVGCDFLDNIKGLGIKKMYNILNKHRDVDTAFKALRSDAKTREIIPDGYEEKWRQARLIFKHALCTTSLTSRCVISRRSGRTSRRNMTIYPSSDPCSTTSKRDVSPRVN